MNPWPHGPDWISVIGRLFAGYLVHRKDHGGRGSSPVKANLNALDDCSSAESYSTGRYSMGRELLAFGFSGRALVSQKQLRALRCCSCSFAPNLDWRSAYVSSNIQISSIATHSDGALTITVTSCICVGPRPPGPGLKRITRLKFSYSQLDREELGVRGMKSGR